MEIDQQILERHYRVAVFKVNQRKSFFYFLWRLFMMIAFVIRNTWGSAAYITWFADYHAAILVFMGKIFRKKVAIIAGGQEAICYPELKKGVFCNPKRAKFVTYALKNADLVLPNHESLLYHVNTYYDPKGKKDGIRYYIPSFSTPYVVVPNGIDTSRFYRDVKIEKGKRSILTVGTMHTSNDFINKGFDLFIELAKLNSDLSFTMIGIKRSFIPWLEETYKISEIDNLTVIPYLCPYEVLFVEFNKAGIYIQASITEGMPNTLNEAMLCGCIPVGSNVNGIPDAIGQTGVIVKTREISALNEALKKALLLDTGDQAIEHANQFSIEKREEKMIMALTEFLK